MAYIDVVEVHWERYYVDDEEIDKILEEKEKLSSSDVDYLIWDRAYDSEFISRIDIDLDVDFPTIEVYKDNDIIWDNKNND